MRKRPLALLALAFAAAGAGLGVALRPGRDGGPSRPRAVEAVLRAVDRDDRAALERALEDVGAAESQPSPWREEVAFARLVLSGEVDAVWRFATEVPPAAARARALLWLRGRATTVADWQRIESRLEADYPSSWGLLPAGRKAPGDGR